MIIIRFIDSVTPSSLVIFQFILDDWDEYCYKLEFDVFGIIIANIITIITIITIINFILPIGPLMVFADGSDDYTYSAGISEDGYISSTLLLQIPPLLLLSLN